MNSQLQSPHGGSREMEPMTQPGEAQKGPDSADLIAAVWRYRWAVILPGIVGAVIGFMVYFKTPETYESVTKLLVESDQPAIIDSMTGDIVGGVPSVSILESHLFSDRVLSMAFEHDALSAYREAESPSLVEFVGISRDCLTLEAAEGRKSDTQALVVLLQFEHTNKELCRSAVTAFSSSLQSFFNERQKSSRSELIRMINVATENTLPRISKLEEEYRQFRRVTPLEWNSKGEAINPHRERQLGLMKSRSEYYERLRRKALEYEAIAAVSQQAKSPLMSLSIIGQLLGVQIKVPSAGGGSSALMLSRDGGLLKNQVQKSLIPLEIRRNKFAEEFGEGHPTVKQLDAELTVMRSEMLRLAEEESEIAKQIAEDNAGVTVDPVEQAKEAVETVLIAANAERQLLERQLEEIDKQIAFEKGEAVKLAKFEQENVAMLREIESNKELITQLERRLAMAEMTEEENGTKVISQVAPTQPRRVGPILALCLGLGAFLGLASGAGLALLLEKNANTFRDPDEIAQVLGTPVLTHVPFFKGRIRKPKKGEINPYKDLDPYLAVVHSPASVPAEAIRSCRTSLFFETAGGEGGKIIQVTSPLPGDGKSTIAGNLACSIAQSGKSVLAIDCDLRRPQLTDNFGCKDKLGLTAVLNGDCEPDDASHQTPLKNLRVMPSGAIPTNPAEALTLPEMVELMKMLREKYDYIILDTPPLLVVTDPSITASMVDGVVLALRIRRKSKPNAKESLNILRTVGARVFGIVINNSDESGSSDGYKGYGYYRYGRYTNQYHRGSRGSGQPGSVKPVIVSGRGSGRTQAVPSSPAVISEPTTTAMVAEASQNPGPAGGGDVVDPIGPGGEDSHVG